MGNFVEGLDRSDLPVGTKYGIRDNAGIPQRLPELIGNKRWVQFDHNEYGRMYVVEEVLKSNAYTAGARMYKENNGSGNYIPPKPDDENLYWVVEKADSNGVLWVCAEKKKPEEPDYETLRKQYSDAMIAAESAKDQAKAAQRTASDRHAEYIKEVKLNERLQKENKNMRDELEILYEGNRKLTNEKTETVKAELLNEKNEEIRILKQENTAFDNNFRSVVRENDKLREKDKELVYENKCLREELDSLQRAIVEPEDCAMTEQSPEAKAYEDMHTKRMAAEIEAIELDNKAKRNALTKEVAESEWKAKYEREHARFEHLKQYSEEQHYNRTAPIFDKTYQQAKTGARIDSLQTNTALQWVLIGGLVAYEFASSIFGW